jgi:hypothetical protein
LPRIRKILAKRRASGEKEIATILNRSGFPPKDLSGAPENLFSGELFASFWLQKEVGHGAKPREAGIGEAYFKIYSGAERVLGKPLYLQPVDGDVLHRSAASKGQDVYERQSFPA